MDLNERKSFKEGNNGVPEIDALSAPKFLCDIPLTYQLYIKGQGAKGKGRPLQIIYTQVDPNPPTPESMPP